jgi:multiple sugar transport system ATP-binding protein
MSAVTLRGITKRFPGQVAVSDLTLDIRAGEFVTLLGPSGCGKTTLLRMVAGLETIDEGELRIGDKVFNDVPAQRRGIAMVFQSYALFPHMSVRDNILFGLRIKKATPLHMEEKLKWALAMLSLEGLERRSPREMSGGQRQRVALARALVLDPDVLLLDEPLSNLDAALREMAMEELKRIHRQVHKTVIYVTHNQIEAMTMSDRVAVLNKGHLEQYDTPRAVYDQPRTAFAAGFVGSPSMNFYEGTIDTESEQVGVRSPIGFLLLDERRRGSAQSLVGRVVRVGIRPQNVMLSRRQESRRSSDSRIGLAVELVESMGDRSLVVGRTANGTIVRFLIDRDEDFGVDGQVVVFVDGRRLHIFDRATGLNLFSEAPVGPPSP